MNKYYVLFLSLFFLCSCQKNAYVINNNQIIEYRRPIDPVGSVAKNFVNNDKKYTYEQLFISWLNEHSFLEQNLHRGFLTTVESHRNIQNILTNIKVLLSREKQFSLMAYQKLYDNLLSYVRRKTSARVLLPRYKALKNKIKSEFF